MGAIPRSMNEDYRGAPFACWVLAVLGALNLARGSIHLLASDGGAGQIAGIDLSLAGDTVVFLFAIMGLQQLAFGVLDLTVALRYRAFVPLLLALETLKLGVAVVVMWFYKPLSVAAPGKYGAVVLLPLLVLALLMSLRPRTQAGADAAPPGASFTSKPSVPG